MANDVENERIPHTEACPYLFRRVRDMDNVLHVQLAGGKEAASYDTADSEWQKAYLENMNDVANDSLFRALTGIVAGCAKPISYGCTIELCASRMWESDWVGAYPTVVSSDVLRFVSRELASRNSVIAESMDSYGAVVSSYFHSLEDQGEE